MKYEGDFIICKFNISQSAMKCVEKVYMDIEAFNMGKESDYQIKTSISLAKGNVLISEQKDIFRDPWLECCV